MLRICISFRRIRNIVPRGRSMIAPTFSTEHPAINTNLSLRQNSPLPLGEVPQITDLGRRGLVISLSVKNQRFLPALPEGEPSREPLHSHVIDPVLSHCSGRLCIGPAVRSAYSQHCAGGGSKPPPYNIHSRLCDKHLFEDLLSGNEPGAPIGVAKSTGLTVSKLSAGTAR